MNNQNEITEAKQWLTNNKNPSALAGNRFPTTKDALQFVEKLYEVGAEKVEIDNLYDEDERISSEGGPYADSLIVVLPPDSEKRIKLFDIFNEEAEREGSDHHVDEGQSEVMLWWD